MKRLIYLLTLILMTFVANAFDPPDLSKQLLNNNETIQLLGDFTVDVESQIMNTEIQYLINSSELQAYELQLPSDIDNQNINLLKIEEDLLRVQVEPESNTMINNTTISGNYYDLINWRRAREGIWSNRSTDYNYTT